jgi:hypothetical protein
MLTREQTDYLQAELKFAGFGTKVNPQLEYQSVLLERTEFSLRHTEQINQDRMFYNIKLRQGDPKAFYNGFEAIIVKNMPTAFVAGGVDLKDLEIRLAAPPQLIPSKPDSAAEYEKRLAQYNAEIISDLKLLFAQSKDLFYKVVGVYPDVINPLLDPAAKDTTLARVEALKASGEIRKQWFSARQSITMIEAYNLLDSTKLPRAVFKTYFKRDDPEDDKPQQQEQPTQLSQQQPEPQTQGQQQPKQEQSPDQVQEKAKSETYSLWLMLDYVDKDGVNPTKYGNRTFHSFSEAWGFDLRRKLENFAFVGLDSKEAINELAKQLEKGHIIEVAPVNDRDHKVVYIFANPAGQSISILSQKGELLEHPQFLTAEALTQRQQRGADRGHSDFFKVATRPGGSGEDDHLKKNSNQQSRNVQPPKPGGGQKPH